MHVPAGAIPKDGPSAGVTMVTALTSLLTERPVKHTVGMTGEVTLQGRVLPIGGLKQKVLAAHAAGLTDVILPERNRGDLDDVPEEVRDADDVPRRDDHRRGADRGAGGPAAQSHGLLGGVATPIDVDAYLARIGYAGPRQADDHTLIELHRAHMLAAPFENLDIHLGGRNVLGHEAAYSKVVERHRGGWCFELNGAFAALLAALGFDVTLMGALVHSETGPAANDNHLCLRWPRTACGWPTSASATTDRPILLDERGDQERDGRVYRLVPDADRITLTEDGVARYSFSLEPRTIDHFAPENGVADRPGVALHEKPDLLAGHRAGPRQPVRAAPDRDRGRRAVGARAGRRRRVAGGAGRALRHPAGAAAGRPRAGPGRARSAAAGALTHPQTGAVWWATPGGALDPGETHEQAAVRELAEEAGLSRPQLGPWVWTREHLLVWAGVFTRQAERYYLIRTPAFEPAPVARPTRNASCCAASLVDAG